MSHPPPVNECVPARNLPAGATLPPWLEEVAPYYLDRDHMKMMTRAEIAEYEDEPLMSDEQWDSMGSNGGSNFGHPWFRIKED